MPMDDDWNGVTKVDRAALEAARSALMDQTGVQTGVVDVTGSAHVDRTTDESVETAGQPYARHSVVSAGR